MDWTFLAAQCLGILNTIIAVLSMQFKNIRLILISQITLNLITAVGYLLLGGLSGAWICILATLQTTIMFFLEKYDSPKMQKLRSILLVLFAFGYVVGTIIVYKGWNDIVSCICAILFVLAIIQTQSSKYRKYILLNASLWTIYDITTMAYANILTHGLQIISILIAMVRHDQLFSSKEKKQ